MHWVTWSNFMIVVTLMWGIQRSPRSPNPKVCRKSLSPYVYFFVLWSNQHSLWRLLLEAWPKPSDSLDCFSGWEALCAFTHPAYSILLFLVHIMSTYLLMSLVDFGTSKWLLCYNFWTIDFFVFCSAFSKMSLLLWFSFELKLIVFIELQ